MTQRFCNSILSKVIVKNDSLIPQKRTGAHCIKFERKIKVALEAVHLDEGISGFHNRVLAFVGGHLTLNSRKKHLRP